MQCPACSHEVPEGSRFCGQCGAPVTADPVAAPPSPPAASGDAPPAALKSRDERRFVAILFADISGFTRICEGLDPEEVHAMMNDCFAGLGRAIEREGGYIDKYIGDNVMALFGAPVAHEDDPARACRAALAMQEFISSMAIETGREKEGRLSIRIGINYGLVIAGGIGSDVKREYSVLGDVVNVASRLESTAEPGTVLVSEAVRERTMGSFEFGPLRSLAVKGKTVPVSAYELTSVRGRDDRSDSIRRAAPLTGRDEELHRVLAWLDADVRPAPWLIVEGGAGSGKTRLVEEAVAERPSARMIDVPATEAECRQPFGLARRLLTEALVAAHGGDEAVQSRGRFAEVLGASLAPYEPALWYLVSPTAADPPDEDPEALRGTIERGIASFLAEVRRRFPRWVIFLDRFELADGASAELLVSLAGERADAPRMIVGVRPDEGRTERPDGIKIRLDALDSEAATRLIEHIDRAAVLAPPLRSRLIERTAGIPLFIETTVHAVLESAAGMGDGGLVPVGKIAGDVELPSSLHALMISRVDRLGSDCRGLLCEFAVQGEDFDLEAGARVHERVVANGGVIEPFVAELESGGFIARPSGERSVEGRVFTPRLLQQSCYESLLVRDRRELHALIADVLVDLAEEGREILTEQLAFHEERAERLPRAAAAYVRAAERAARLFLNEQAIECFEHALDLIERSGDEAMGALAAKALRGAADVDYLTGEYARAEERVKRLLEVATNQAQRDEGLRIRANLLERRGRRTEALDALEAIVASAATTTEAQRVHADAWLDLAGLRRAAAQPDRALECVGRARGLEGSDELNWRLKADLVEGRILHVQGRFDEANAIYERAYAAAMSTSSLSRQSLASNRLGNIARDRGEYERALDYYKRALRDWTRMGQIEAVAGASNNLGNVAMSLGDHDCAEEHFRRSLELNKEINNVPGVALAHANLGLRSLEIGDGESAVRCAEDSIAALGAGAGLLRGLVTVVLGEGHCACGRYDEAQTSFESVLDSAAIEDNPLAVAGAERGLGRVHMARGEMEDGTKRLESARERFGTLHRAQEEARTRLYLAEAWLSRAMMERARREETRAALETFEAINAIQDVERARTLLGRIETAPQLGERGLITARRTQ